MAKLDISAIVLSKNEEKNLGRCLRSIDFCNELIIIDDNSTDKTKDIAQKYQAKVYKQPLSNNFSKQRNFSVTKAKYDWILFVDADEEVSNELKSEIQNIKLDNKEISAYYLKRRDFFWGRELRYGETAKARNKGLIRLFKKDAGEWQGVVHEEFVVKNNYQAGYLHSYINHYPHQTLKEFIEDVNTYSSLRAGELQKKGCGVNIGQIIFFPLGKFIYTYFLKLGFLDGASGFVYAFMMSFHSFLVRAKLYQYKYLDSN